MLLRYPGGKAQLYNFVRDLISKHNFKEKIYVEPFSGGFGLGLKLLVNNDVGQVIINDLDRHIYCFWKCVFYHTTRLIKKINETEISIQEWFKQKEIYNNSSQYGLVDVGFSTLFLNRTNYSGILKSGPIGGFKQEGDYKINCRFNKELIINNILKVSNYKENVQIFNFDATSLIKRLKNSEHSIFYNFDPPYVVKGHELYLNAYEEKDHKKLMTKISEIDTHWIMTYDDTELIRHLYNNYFIDELSLVYSVTTKRKANELIISNFEI